MAAGTETDARHRRFRARRDGFRETCVAVDEKFAVSGKQFREPAFFFRHAVHVAEKFQMLAPDTRDDTEARLNHRDQRRDFPGMIGADLEHRRLVMRLQPQQRERHANVVVEARLAPERGKFLTQHRRDEFLRRGFAVRAADRDDGQREVAAILRREPGERLAGVFHCDERAVEI